MEWKIFNRNVDTGDPNYPLEVIEDGYKMIRLIKNEEHYSVEWGWKLTVKNKSNESKFVIVVYILKDIDEFEVSSDTKSYDINAGETKTIRNTSIMRFDNVKRVVSSMYIIVVGVE